MVYPKNAKDKSVLNVVFAVFRTCQKKPVELCGGCPALQNEHVFNFGIHGVMRFEVVAKRVEIAYSFISMGWWEDGDNPWSLRLQNLNEL